MPRLHMKQTIVVNDLPPMLNGKNGLKRMHWTRYQDVRDKWVYYMLQAKPHRHQGQVAIHFIRYSTARPDWDNLYASFKVIGDSLVISKTIVEDNPGVVVKLTAEWEKCRRKDQRTEIIIEDAA